MTWQSGGGGTSYPGVTGDGQTPGGLVVAGSEQVAGTLNVGDLSNGPDPAFPLQVGPGGNSLFLTAAGALHILLSVVAPFFTATGGTSNFTSSDQTQQPLAATGAGISTGSAFTFTAANALNQKAGFDGAVNVKSDTGLGIWGHAAPLAQPVLATGAGHTVDDVIALLQSYGLCRQA